MKRRIISMALACIMFLLAGCTVTLRTDDNGKNTASNALFTVSGNLKSGVAARTIDGVEYKTALKMETTTSITFSITKPMKMTLYFDATPSVTIDDVKTKNLKGATISDSGNDLSITLAAGNHVITKDGTINLYLIKLEPIE